MHQSGLTHVFLDANTALHFKRADQIDWCSLAETADVVLVAAPVFLRELEQQKVHNPSRKLRDRAKETIKWLHGFLDSTPTPAVRPHVSLTFISCEPQIDFAARRLSERLNDDHLIASAV